jgi:solute carrier family 35 (GDP-fucose transporter), member C1
MGPVHCQEAPSCRHNQHCWPRVQHPLSSRSGGNVFPGIDFKFFFFLSRFQLNTGSHQIARGLVLPLTIAVTSVTTHAHPSIRVIIATGIVTIGFFVGVAPTGNIPVSSIPSPISLFYGVFSSLAIAIHTVMIKSSLPYCNNSTIQLAYWTNAGSAILVAPFVMLLGEPVRILELSASPDWNMKVFVWGSFVTGLFGFLLCVAGLLSIKVTSPVTHMFSSVRVPISLRFSCHQRR